MKNYIKRYNKSLLLAGVCLFSVEVFSASEASKKLIHETLSKYGISAGGKRVCDTDEEPYYNKSTGKVDCYNNKYKENNCWDADNRLCKRCPNATILNKNNYVSCHKIVCPEGYELVEVKDKTCPEGFELRIYQDSYTCASEYNVFNEISATNNYTTQSINCKNVPNNNILDIFYTCIPTDSWFNKKFDLIAREEMFKFLKII